MFFPFKIAANKMKMSPFEKRIRPVFFYFPFDHKVDSSVFETRFHYLKAYKSREAINLSKRSKLSR